MEQTNNSVPTVFNPMQLQLLRMFSYVKTDEQLKEIKAALADYFFKKVEAKFTHSRPPMPVKGMPL